jgi:hypothetical protein
MWPVSSAGQSRTQFWPRSFGPFITIAWEPSDDPSVVGYVVYVGTDSRTYIGAYDVGARTSFVYPHATVNRRHFFAVAAYSAAADVGSLSDEVSGFGRIVPPSGYKPDFTVPPLGNGGLYLPCATGRLGCLEATTVSESTRQISALTSSAKGQVWFVEEKQQIYTIDVDGTVSRVNRPSGASRGDVEGIVIDPRFDETRHVYIQEIERHRDGSRELTIARYREMQGTLRSRAEVVSAIRLPATGNVPFTVDDEGRIFVAVPRDQKGPRPHEGVVFAVEPDGTYAKGPSGAASWRGVHNPSSLVWDAAGGELWLSGSNAGGSATVERLSSNSSRGIARRALTTSNHRYLLFPAPGGRLLRVDRQATRVETVSVGGGERVTAVSGAAQDIVFAVTRTSDAVGSRIVAIPVAD